MIYSKSQYESIVSIGRIIIRSIDCFKASHYRKHIDLKSNGAKVVFVDCDGYPGGLIPEWIDVGVDGMSPVEIAAGNDVIEIRKKYPGLIMFGGIDKREHRIYGCYSLKAVAFMGQSSSDESCLPI